jgi:hypothetical protein
MRDKIAVDEIAEAMKDLVSAAFENLVRNCFDIAEFPYPFLVGVTKNHVAHSQSIVKRVDYFCWSAFGSLICTEFDFAAV